MDSKAPDAFRTISEVADELDLPQHVLRFWETRFRDIKPMKRGGGRRYYRPDDIDLLRGIRHLLYGEGYTIRGVQRILREQGIKFVQTVWTEGAPQPPHVAQEDEPEEAVSAEGVSGEEAGLRGKLASFIGRDLGERGGDAAGRREPPLKSAPMPRVDPSDRLIHSAAATSETSDEEDEPPAVAAPSAVSVGVTRRRLDDEGVQKLQAAMHELSECRKLIEAAVARTD